MTPDAGIPEGGGAAGAGLQKLDSRDRRFIALCLLVIVAGGAITAALFRRAFPEASIDFRVPRARARVLAESFLSRQRRPLAGTRFA
ncbi:MAG TPA: hypothetical protein VIZ58_05370, partial [Thermoanaerobaculia bacterium]